ncbi:N-terminal acetyltransferase A complex subunit Nat1p [Diutina catenulata]
MGAKKATPIFAHKEDSQFREALKLYDAKQYKKALKIVDQNLKKNSSHAESLALKGCLQFHLNHKDEAEGYIVKALAKAPQNYLVDHLAGIYYRGVENYPEAAKWLKASMDNGSPNKPILRDLSAIQSQIRDYKNLKDSRQQYLESQPGYRANWTAVAVAHHLGGDYTSAANTLSKIEDIIRDHLTEADRYEQSECSLYKNQIICEGGNYQMALDTLEKDSDDIRDRLGYTEYRAKYLMMLGRTDEAATEYRRLIQRNPDNAGYYHTLEAALGVSQKEPAYRYRFYQKMARFYPKSDPPKYLPLTFLPADSPEFAEAASAYVLGQLKRGVPSTFVNAKPVLKNKAKQQVIEQMVLDFYANQVPELDRENPTVRVWTQYFLAQNYLWRRQLDDADRYIDAALDHSPTLVELYIVKARVAKHRGKAAEAAQWMDQGRKLDLQDRFINSKTTKYLLRANQVDEAIDAISLFTKLDEEAVNGCKDLHTMQVNWLLVESAEAYVRLYRAAAAELAELKQQAKDDDEQVAELREKVDIYRGLALKRFNAVIKVFAVFFHDQFDFHSYCMRRGTPRDYVATIRWEDQVYGTPIYVRAVKGLADVYFDLQQLQPTAADDAKNKKAKKPAKTSKKLTKMRNEWATKVESVKDDADPLGAQALADALASDLMEQLFVVAKPLAEQAKDFEATWRVLFRVYVAQGKYVLALQAIKQLARLHYPVADAVAELKQTMEGDEQANAAIKQVVAKGIEAAFPDL